MELPISRDTFAVGNAGTQTERQFQVVLNPCLSDTDRVEAATGGCRLRLSLVLNDDDGELGSGAVDLGLVRKGDQVVPSAIRLVPSYTLAISGGGPGSGTGTISVPAVGDQPALECEITSGSGATSGCSGRYPPHTVLTLVATSGQLTAWGSDCEEIAATDPCQLTMDDRRTVSASFSVPRSGGDLTVQIAGLPEDVSAQVTVTNGRGYRQDLTETTSLTDLEPGNDYSITAEPVAVTAEDRTYTPEPAVQQATVAAGELTTVQIGYNPPETGTLAVEIAGLPVGVSAQVHIGGPGLDPPRLLTAGEVLASLEPGTYTITADDVETAQQVYGATPDTQRAIVDAGATTQAAVSYAATRGSLAVAVSGLPAGAPADITVTGPGFSQELTGTLTLLKLNPGTYDVVAENVRAAGRTFAPVPPSQSIPVGPGEGLHAAIGYTALPPARLVKQKGDDESCVVTTYCDDMFQVLALDADGNPVAGATVRWTAVEATDGCREGSLGTHTDVETDAQGIAHASNQCTYPTAGRYTQTAELVIGEQPVASTRVSFSFILITRPPSPDRSTIEVSPTTLRTCCDTATVTVTARDETGNPLTGLPVVLEASSASVSIQAQPSEVTSASGIATGRIVGRANGTVQIAARIGGVLLQQTAAVTVSAGIAFVVDGEIFAVGQEGLDPRNLTAGIPGEASSPAWSPDGSKIAFILRQCVEDGPCVSDIYVMRSDGTDPLNITIRFQEDAFAPTWSPDGRLLAFHTRPCDEGLCGNIWVMPATISVPTNVTPDVDAAFSPDWSGDGLKIVFVLVECEKGCAVTLATMDPTGSNHQSLSGDFGFDNPPEAPQWSPDGSRIAFGLTACEGCNGDIATVTSSGSDLVNLTQNLEEAARFPSWSPMGGRIAFARDTCNDGCFEIEIMSSRDGSDLTPLTRGSEPSWR